MYERRGTARKMLNVDGSTQSQIIEQQPSLQVEASPARRPANTASSIGARWRRIEEEIAVPRLDYCRERKMRAGRNDARVLPSISISKLGFFTPWRSNPVHRC